MLEIETIGERPEELWGGGSRGLGRWKQKPEAPEEVWVETL